MPGCWVESPEEEETEAKEGQDTEEEEEDMAEENGSTSSDTSRMSTINDSQCVACDISLIDLDFDWTVEIHKEDKLSGVDRAEEELTFPGSFALFTVCTRTLL